MPHETTPLQVRGVNIQMRRAGKGDKVLFLHGAGGVMVWLPFFEQLAQKYEVLVPDHPAFGGSDDPDRIRHVPDRAFFYLDLMEQLGLDRVHVIGNSLGGWLASEIAIRDDSRIASLTLLAPAGIRVKGVETGDNFIWGPEESIRNIYFDQAIAERLIAMPLDDAANDLILKNRFAAAKYGWKPRWFNPDLEKWLHRIQVPTHVVWGADDKLFPASYAARWAECIPGATATVIPQCGHLPHAEKPAVVLEQFDAFVAASTK